MASGTCDERRPRVIRGGSNPFRYIESGSRVLTIPVNGGRTARATQPRSNLLVEHPASQAAEQLAVECTKRDPQAADLPDRSRSGTSAGTASSIRSAGIYRLAEHVPADLKAVLAGGRASRVLVRSRRHHSLPRARIPSSDPRSQSAQPRQPHRGKEPVPASSTRSPAPRRSGPNALLAA